MNGGSLSGTSSGILNVTGSFIISSGATATMGNINLTVTGLTSISGTLTDNSTGGSNVFNNVDLNATGKFDNTAAETYTINGNLNTYGGDFLATGATPIFNIAGNFNVVSGICDVSRIRFTISGITTISGTLAINSVRGKAININSFNSSNETYDMALQSKVGVSGTYRIDASGFDFVYEYRCIQLEDKLKHITVNHREQSTYEFDMQTTDSPNRFVIHFSKQDDCKSSFALQPTHADFADNVEVLPTSVGSAIHFSFDETTSVTVEVVNLLGQTIF